MGKGGIPALDLGHSVDASGLRAEINGGSFKSEGAVMGYYEVVDRNGFVMRLTEFGDAHFYVNQVVNARVTSINQVRVELAPFRYILLHVR